MRMRPLLVLWPPIVSVCTLTSGVAHAAGMDELLTRALENDPEIAASVAQGDASGALVGQARAGLLPRLSATAAYTRNQFGAEVAFPGQDPVVITPVDQLEAIVRLDVPLVDVGGWSTLSAAVECRDAARSQLATEERVALLEVVRAAWDVRAAARTRDAAAASVASGQALAEVAAARFAAGTGSDADRLRAVSDLAGAQEALAESAADLDAARRALAARTGVDGAGYELAPRGVPTGDLAVSARERPEVSAARATLACRTATRNALLAGIAPDLSAFAQERITNATGFAGQAATWAVGAQVSWVPLDGGRRTSQLAEATANQRLAEAQLARREREALDALADSEARLGSARIAVEAGQARIAAAAAARSDAEARFAAGTGTSADVSAALAETFDAEVNLARAETRYAVAIEVLRVAAGQPLLLETP